MAGKVRKDSRLPTPRLLAAARILADLSQDGLGELSGVNRTVISRYEAGDTTMRPNNLARLVVALRARGIRFTGTAVTARIGVEMDNPLAVTDRRKRGPGKEKAGCPGQPRRQAG